jgi:hypothetical protein
MAWCNLGHTLTQQGNLEEGLKAMKRGHELGSADASWSYPSAAWIQEAEQRIALDQKLALILKGEVLPGDAKEQFALGELCVGKRQFAAAVRFFKTAFAADASLSLAPSARYNAACAASLAASGKGSDAKVLTDEERTSLSRDALAWLQAELELCRRQLSGDPAERQLALVLLQHSIVDADLASLRDPASLALLPADDQASWKEFWRNVELLKANK